MNIQFDQKFLENWQYNLRDQIQNVRLVDLVIPGTHNSNTYTFEQIGSAFGKNQILDIEQQLKGGIRFLDLRYGMNKSEDLIVDKHGPLTGEDYFEKFEIIKKFIQTHKNEFIVIKIQAEDELTENWKEKFKKLLHKKIGQYLVDKDDTWFDLAKVTMKQIFQHKKRIFLVYKRHLTEFSDSEEIGIYPDEGNFNCFWPNTDKAEELMEKNLEILLERQKNEEKQNNLFLNSFMLTGQEEILKLIKQIATKGLPTIENMIQQLDNNTKVMNFILENIKMPFNIIIMDRMDILPELILLIVILNTKNQLQINFGYYKGQDISQQIVPYIYNNSFLCIQDLSYFLKDDNLETKEFFILYNCGQQNMIYTQQKNSNILLIYDNPLLLHDGIDSQDENLIKSQKQQKQYLKKLISREQVQKQNQKDNQSSLKQIIKQYVTQKHISEN